MHHNNQANRPFFRFSVFPLTIGLIAWFFIAPAATNAQQFTNFNHIVAPLDSVALDFSEYLVQLAWINNPEGAIAEAELDIAFDKERITRKEWMRDIQTTFNLNEANLRSSGVDTFGNVFFPRYNFGLNLNLFSLLSQDRKNSISKREVDIARLRINQKKMEVRAETLTRYALFKAAREVLAARLQVEQETRSAFILVEQQYRTDGKTFEDYATASANFYKAKEERIRSESEVLQTRIRLEEAIGLSWDMISHPKKDL